MKNKMIIDIFRPECFSWHPTKNIDLYTLYGKNWQYASKGRYALYHILKVNKINGKMLIPVYVCDTVLIPLKMLGIEPVFYDINADDLNADIVSFEKMGEKYGVSAALVVSMYGNPADYHKLESICKVHGWFMIDDGAQAIGAELDGKAVGTFGDGGFFSFSPGKPTAGPMGAFFWSYNRSYQIMTTQHNWLHRLIYYDFYYNRVKSKADINSFWGKGISLVVRGFSKIIRIEYDKMAAFEQKYLEDIFVQSLGEYMRRKKYWLNYIEENTKLNNARFLRHFRGDYNCYKCVIVHNTSDEAQEFITYLEKQNIYSSNGYAMLSLDLSDLPNAQLVNNCVVEIPIECAEEKNKLLVDVINKYYAI